MLPLPPGGVPPTPPPHPPPASRGEGAEETAFVRPVRVGSIVLLTVVRDGAKRQVRVQLVQVN